MKLNTDQKFIKEIWKELKYKFKDEWLTIFHELPQEENLPYIEPSENPRPEKNLELNIDNHLLGFLALELAEDKLEDISLKDMVEAVKDNFGFLDKLRKKLIAEIKEDWKRTTYSGKNKEKEEQ